jgi:hypothetical protein
MVLFLNVVEVFALSELRMELGQSISIEDRMSGLFATEPDFE